MIKKAQTINTTETGKKVGVGTPSKTPIVFKKEDFLTKRFSAKEAFLKAVGIGMGRGITFQNISILNDKLGRPILNVDDEAMDFLNKLYNITTDNKLLFNISLTDEKGLVATVVTISK